MRYGYIYIYIYISIYIYIYTYICTYIYFLFYYFFSRNTQAVEDKPGAQIHMQRAADSVRSCHCSSRWHACLRGLLLPEQAPALKQLLGSGYDAKCARPLHGHARRMLRSRCACLGLLGAYAGEQGHHLWMVEPPYASSRRRARGAVEPIALRCRTAGGSGCCCGCLRAAPGLGKAHGEPQARLRNRVLVEWQP